MSRGLNGETVFKADDVRVGYTRTGNPVTVSVRMERLDRQSTYETTDHQQVTRPLDFAITYGIWRRNMSDITEGGAGVAEGLAQVTRYADGWDARKVAELVNLAAYHLNATQAGCDHQTPVLDGRGRPDLDRTPPCPVTGYKYGHAWLVRELPPGFENRVRALFA